MNVSPWNRGLLEKLTITQVVNKSPGFYRTQRFINIFTRVLHDHNLSQTNPVHIYISCFLRVIKEYSIFYMITSQEGLCSMESVSQSVSQSVSWLVS
jgi:hypothetical protein